MNKPVSSMTSIELGKELRERKLQLRSWFDQHNRGEDVSYPYDVAERHQDVLNELTRRELRTLGWLASALIAGIAFFLGAAFAYLM